MAYSKNYPAVDTDPRTSFADGETVLSELHMNAIRDAIQADETYLAETVDPALEEVASSYDKIRANEAAICHLHNFVNYGWQDYSGNISGTLTGVREGMLLTLNGTIVKSSNPYMMKVNNEIVAAGTSNNISSFTNPLTLTFGHTYKLSLIPQSGTITTDTGIDYAARVCYAGTYTAVGYMTSDGANRYCNFTCDPADGIPNVQIGLGGLRNSSGGTTFENWKVLITLEDLTEGIKQTKDVAYNSHHIIEFVEPEREGDASKSGMSFSRSGNRVTLNGSCSQWVYARMYGSASVGVITGSSAYDFAANNYGCASLAKGRTYAIVVHQIGGTVIKNTENGAVVFTVILAGTGTFLSSSGYPNFLFRPWHDSNSFDSYLEFYVPEDATNTDIGIYCGTAGGTGCQNAIFEVNLYDVTDYNPFNDESIAPGESVIAKEDHSVGEYIMLGGELVKVATAIVAGETVGDKVSAATTVAEQLATKVSCVAQNLTANEQAQARANIGAISEDDIADLYMEPWQLVVEKYGVKSGGGNFEIHRNHVVYSPTSDFSTNKVYQMPLFGQYRFEPSTLGSFTPLINEVVPVSIFGNAIKLGFYLNSTTSDRHPVLAYKFCTVEGETVTPISNAYSRVPIPAVNNTLVEQIIPVPADATHVYIGIYCAGWLAGTHDMVYKIDRGELPTT